MAWGAVIGAGIGLVGTAVASSSANRASRDAANATTSANAANLQLAREQRAANEQLFAQYLGSEAQARAYLDALEFGSATYTPGANGISGGLSGFELENYLRERFPQEAALWDSWERAGNSATNGHRTLWGNFQGYLQAQHRPELQQAMTDLQEQQQTEQGGAQTITRDQVMAMLEGTPLAQYANEDYLAREALNEDYRTGAYDLADSEYSDITGQAQENLDQRLALEDQSYAAWLPQSQQAERDAIDLNFSRGGVTGLVGQTREGVGRTTQEAALERNRRRLEGYQAAYSPYYDDMMDATGLRGGRRQSAYDAYSGRRAADFDQYAGDRLNSYADFRGYLTDAANRGLSARNSIAGFNDNYASAATAANNSNAAAQRDAAYQRGQVQQQLFGDIARISGDAWDSIRKKNTSSSTGSGGAIHNGSH